MFRFSICIAYCYMIVSLSLVASYVNAFFPINATESICSNMSELTHVSRGPMHIFTSICDQKGCQGTKSGGDEKPQDCPLQLKDATHRFLKRPVAPGKASEEMHFILSVQFHRITSWVQRSKCTWSTF